MTRGDIRIVGLTTPYVVCRPGVGMQVSRSVKLAFRVCKEILYFGVKKILAY